MTQATTKSANANASAGVSYISPDHLPKNPAFSWVVSVTEPAKTVYVGGLDAVDATGAIIGAGDIAKQTEQVAKNLLGALEAAGARPEHVVKWNIYLVQGQPIQPGLAAFMSVWGQPANPPVITVVYVAGLGRPEFLVEMDAVAVVPQAKQN